MKIASKILEQKSFIDGYRYVIGVDEVGMGALAGPVVVCAVMLNKSFFKNNHPELKNVRDSKLLSPKQRQGLSIKLRETTGLKFKISFCKVGTIDSINIRQASKKAMSKAIKKLLGEKMLRQRRSIKVLVDGSSKIEGLDLEQIAIIGGDRKVFVVACASIIAKVYRDKIMRKYAKKFPKYGFEKHKGYSTKKHILKLIASGPSPIHRRSFAPVAKLL